MLSKSKTAAASNTFITKKGDVKLPGPFSDYNMGPTDDGKGLIVSKGEWSQAFKTGTNIQFEDRTTTVSVKAWVNPKTNPKPEPTPEPRPEPKPDPTHPVVKLDGKSSSYGWGPTEDGKGLVVWKGEWFKIFAAGTTVKFDNGTVSFGADCKIVENLTGGMPEPTPEPKPEPAPVYPVTKLDGSSAHYGWGPTEDGKGMVVWKGEWFKIFEAGSTVKFDNGTVTLGADCKIVEDLKGVTPAPQPEPKPEPAPVYPVTKLDGSSAHYGWGPTEDGKGMVVWKGEWFKIFEAGSTVKFDNGTVTLGADCKIVEDLKGVTPAPEPKPEPVYPVTKLDGSSAHYGWGPTEDGKGMVVWKGNWFQIFEAGSTVAFKNGSVTIGKDGKIVENIDVAKPTSFDAQDDVVAVAGRADDTRPGTVFDPLDNDGMTQRSSFRIEWLEGPKHGTINPIDGSAALSYKPQAGFSGKDSATYKVIDYLTGQHDIATVVFNVSAPEKPTEPGANKAPVAKDDSYNYQPATHLGPMTFNVLTNDSDPDGDKLTATLKDGPTKGKLTLGENGVFSYTRESWEGTDSFTYIANDGKGGKSEAKVTINLNPNPPTAVDDKVSTKAGEPVTFNVLANDTKPEGGANLTLQAKDQPQNGMIEISPNGQILYVPKPGFTGTDTFTYWAYNGNLSRDEGKVTIDVTAKTPPTEPSNPGAINAVDDAITVKAGQAITFNPLTNDKAPANTSLLLSVADQPDHGMIVVHPSGMVVYRPNPGFSGTDSFTYYASAGAERDEGKVTITVEMPGKAAAIAALEAIENASMETHQLAAVDHSDMVMASDTADYSALPLDDQPFDTIHG